MLGTIVTTLIIIYIVGCFVSAGLMMGIQETLEDEDKFSKKELTLSFLFSWFGAAVTTGITLSAIVDLVDIIEEKGEKNENLEQDCDCSHSNNTDNKSSRKHLPVDQKANR